MLSIGTGSKHLIRKMKDKNAKDCKVDCLIAELWFKRSKKFFVPKELLA